MQEVHINIHLDILQPFLQQGILLVGQIFDQLEVSYSVVKNVRVELPMSPASQLDSLALELQRREIFERVIWSPFVEGCIGERCGQWLV